jgi:hypothetical protein
MEEIMIRKKSALKKLKNRKIEIDLTGPDGNAYALLAYAKTLYKEMGKSDEKILSLQKDMMSGDYEHLLQVFDREFGDFVTMYR